METLHHPTPPLQILPPPFPPKNQNQYTPSLQQLPSLPNTPQFFKFLWIKSHLPIFMKIPKMYTDIM